MEKENRANIRFMMERRGNAICIGRVYARVGARLRNPIRGGALARLKGG